MAHLRSVFIERDKIRDDRFPFNLPLVKQWDQVDFDTPVTILVGENGTGKSTLLEAMAAAMDKIAIGAEDVASDPTLAPARRLAEVMRCVWNKKTNRGFFLRAEDFFGYAKRLSAIKADLSDLDIELEGKFEGYALQVAKQASVGQAAALTRRYGSGLDHRWHGESFLQLFQSRFVAKGLYLLDEPEAPLSPIRQLSLLAMIKEMVAAEGQFIIATHSPILMAFPGARIYCLDELPPRIVTYEDVPHVTLTKAFLNDPTAYLRRL